TNQVRSAPGEAGAASAGGAGSVVLTGSPSGVPDAGPRPGVPGGAGSDPGRPMTIPCHGGPPLVVIDAHTVPAGCLTRRKCEDCCCRPGEDRSAARGAVRGRRP